MTRAILGSNEFLNEYLLCCEFSKICGVSQNAYKYWSKVVSAHYSGSRTVFLHRDSIPAKFSSYIVLCTKLDGLVLSSAFCAFTGLSSSHLIKSNNSSFYKLVEIKQICGIKFVNLKKFYDDFGLSYDKQIYIEKSKYFSPSPLERQIRLTSTLSLGYY